MVTEGHCGHCGHSRGVFSSRLVMSCARGRAAARVWQDWHATSGSPAVSPEPLSASHASASGVPPCEAHGSTRVAGWQGGRGRTMGGGGRATWGHGFVDGIRSPLHAISSGPQRALSQCSSSAFPRSARKPVTCPVPQLGPPAASSSAGPALHSSCCIARPFPPYP